MKTIYKVLGLSAVCLACLGWARCSKNRAMQNEISQNITDTVNVRQISNDTITLGKADTVFFNNEFPKDVFEKCGNVLKKSTRAVK